MDVIETVVAISESKRVPRSATWIRYRSGSGNRFRFESLSILSQELVWVLNFFIKKQVEGNKQHALVMWIIWFAILQGAFVIQWFLGKGIPQGENLDEPMAFWLWLLCFVPILLATSIRWLLIPKLQAPQAQLVAMIVGLSLAEAPIFFSLFLIGPDYPQNQIAVLMLAVVTIIQFAPSYATPGYKQG